MADQAIQRPAVFTDLVKSLALTLGDVGAPGKPRELEHFADASYLLAQLAAWAYAELDDFKLVLKRMFDPSQVATECSAISLTNDALVVNAHAYIVKIDVQFEDKIKRIGVLIFRGTSWQKALDWMVNASVETMQFGDYGHVHGGFLRNVLWLGDEIRNKLKITELAHLDAVFVTGHSLGGAMAALMTMILWTDRTDGTYSDEFRKRFCGLYTFGAPAVGDATFVDQCPRNLADITFLHVYENDIVPHMPSRSMGKFQHFGKVYHSATDGWVHGKPLTQTYTAIAANVLGLSHFALKVFSFTRWVPPVLSFVAKNFPFMRLLILSWTDHSPLNYVRCSQMSTLPPAG
ncbi:lipase family protein [Sorangium sp. So ce363]|uniref:lipase family protein n=1 Tax=Sorangium sp. So ce363 TaxID=3133304 RepID=UPI003F62DA92